MPTCCALRMRKTSLEFPMAKTVTTSRNHLNLPSKCFNVSFGRSESLGKRDFFSVMKKMIKSTANNPGTMESQNTFR